MVAGSSTAEAASWHGMQRQRHLDGTMPEMRDGASGMKPSFSGVAQRCPPYRAVCPTTALLLRPASFPRTPRQACWIKGWQTSRGLRQAGDQEAGASSESRSEERKRSPLLAASPTDKFCRAEEHWSSSFCASWQTLPPCPKSSLGPSLYPHPEIRTWNANEQTREA